MSVHTDSKQSKLESAANDAVLDLFKIKGVAQILACHPATDENGFPEDLAGGLSALADLTEDAYKRLAKVL